jgi:exopolysaccharide biosynthesis polyprenyl glycosylphosphotransferase
MFEELLDDQRRASDLAVPAEIADSRPRRKGGAASLYRKVAVGMVVTDGLAALVGVLIGWVAFRTGPRQAHAWQLVVVIAPVAVTSIFAAYRLYRLQWLAPSEEFRRIISAVSVAVVVLNVSANLTARVLLGGGHPIPITAGWLAAQWLAITVLVMAERKGWHRVLHRMRRSGALALRTVIVGLNAEGRDLAKRLQDPALGFDVVGLVSVGEGLPDPTNGQRILGTIGELGSIVRAQDIDCAFLGSSALDPEEMRGVLTTLRRLNVQVRVSANVPQILASRLSVQMVGSTLALSLQTTSLSGPQAVAKRVFDLLVGGLAVILTSPIWLTSAIAIKLTSRGPILYRQPRIGRHGRAFTMVKFRTMVVDADRMVGDLHELNEGQGPLFKIEADPRLTTVGRLLRRWSVDELPQLLNVLKGEMSLVGPRPMPASFGQEHYEDWHLGRLEVPPGMTGLWQVSGRSELTFDECVRLDLLYIENWSVAYDLFIICKTVPAVLRRRGAV